METKKQVSGGYFLFCQWCKFDKNCELRHNEFMGVPSSGGLDSTPYPGHEDLRWHLSIFQAGHIRSTCNGRIFVSGSIFYPLVCECGTAIDGFCQKFEPNEKGLERKRIAQEILAERPTRLFPEFEDEIFTDEELELLEELSPTDFDYETVDGRYRP